MKDDRLHKMQAFETVAAISLNALRFVCGTLHLVYCRNKFLFKKNKSLLLPQFNEGIHEPSYTKTCMMRVKPFKSLWG